MPQDHQAQPLISALMVSLPDPERFTYFRWSVASYLRQTWRKKELVVLLDRRGSASEADRRCRWLESLARPDIRVIRAEKEMSLGSLRNRAMTLARGTVACTWDDDDLSHRKRLETQVSELLRA